MPLLLAGLAGCGSSNRHGALPDAAPVPTSPPSLVGDTFYRSGARLRANRVVVDGVSSFAGWHDLLMDVDCTFAETSDGVYACVPTADSPNYGSFAFADSACTEPRVTLGPCMSAKVAVQRRQLCLLSVNVKWLGPVETHRDDSYVKDGGSCSQYKPGVPLTMAPLGDDVTLVTAKRRRETVGDGFARDLLVGDDGSIELLRIIDATHDLPCDLHAIATDDSPRCEPSGTAYVNYFREASCTVKVASIGSCVTTGPTIVQTAPGSWAEVGAAYAGPLYYHDTEGVDACVLVPNDGRSNFIIGNVIANEALPAWRIVQRGSGRTRLRVAETPSGTPLIAIGLYDSERSEACALRRSTDGTARCLPLVRRFGPGLGEATWYSDSKCTKTLVQGEHENVVAEVVHSGCDTRTRILAVGDRVSLSTVYEGHYDGTCVATPVSVVSSPYFETYEIPATSFPEGASTTD